jgi:hypothetical protein
MILDQMASFWPWLVAGPPILILTVGST